MGVTPAPEGYPFPPSRPYPTSLSLWRTVPSGQPGRHLTSFFFQLTAMARVRSLVRLLHTTSHVEYGTSCKWPNAITSVKRRVSSPKCPFWWLSCLGRTVCLNQCVLTKKRQLSLILSKISRTRSCRWWRNVLRRGNVYTFIDLKKTLDVISHQVAERFLLLYDMAFNLYFTACKFLMSVRLSHKSLGFVKHIELLICFVGVMQ